MALKLGKSFRYRFDTFMARGGVSIFISLLIVFLVMLIVLALLRGLLVSIFPPDQMPVQHDELGFWGQVYITFLELTAPGNMNQDLTSSPAYKILAIVAGLSGVIIFSALIAFLTTGLNQKLNKLKRGHSKVIEEGHTLILGWNEQRIVEIIRELIYANESEQVGVVVVLANEDKEMMDETLRRRIPNSRNTRIVTRSGNVSALANLDVVSVEDCKSVIILATCSESAGEEEWATSDAKVIQSILAVTSKIKDEEKSIVAEIFSASHRAIVARAFPKSVVAVDTNDILAKILVQTSRSVGLSVVYNEVLSFDGSEMYFYHAEWGEIAFSELVFRFPDGVPMGVRDKAGHLRMNPPADYQLKPTDDVLILAQDDSTINFLPEPVAQAQDHPLVARRKEQVVEQKLILGWTNKARTIIDEYADYVLPGSRIDIMLADPTEEDRAAIEAANAAQEDIDIHLLVRDKLNIEDLMAVQPFRYDNIVILAEVRDQLQVHKIDSSNIVALLLIRDIFRRYPDQSTATKLITEVLDSQNYPLLVEAGVKDVIISSRLISMILAQVSEDADIKLVYDDLFEEAGAEIYIKSTQLYFEQLPVEVSFADILRLVQKREEVCLGVKMKADEMNSDANFGVTLIPEKNTRFTLTAEDAIVVLAEDES
ncbi:MAG: hypothetical protein AAF570_07715 [Bacteroidota bacterium]